MAQADQGFKRASDFLKSHAEEAVKEYLTYDGVDRLQYHYTALAGAVNGDACLRTEYVYRTATSTQVMKRKEIITTWDSTWDI